MNKEAESYFYDLWRGAAARYKKAEAQVEKYRKHIDQLGLDGVEIHVAKRKAEAELTRAGEYINWHQTTVRKLEAELAEAKKQLDYLAGTVEVITADRDRLQERVEGLSRQVILHDTENGRLQAALDDWQNAMQKVLASHNIKGARHIARNMLTLPRTALSGTQPERESRCTGCGEKVKAPFTICTRCGARESLYGGQSEKETPCETCGCGAPMRHTKEVWECGGCKAVRII